MTADLIAFLRARLDEDEQVVRAATPGPWQDGGGYVTDTGPHGPNAQITDYGTQDGEQGSADSAHIARWDPARVLAEVDAKRRILAEYEQTVTRAADMEPGTPETYTRRLREWSEQRAQMTALNGVLRLLTLPYADYPDYRPEWRPDGEPLAE
jgi:hypothetical protein